MSHVPTPVAPPHVRRIVALGYCGLLAAMVYLGLKSEWEDPLITIASLIIFALGMLPLLGWLRRNDDTYPIVEFFLFTTVPFYAIPVLTGHEALVNFSEQTVLEAALAVIAFQLAGLCGSAASASSFRPQRTIRAHWWREEILPEAKMHFTAYTALLNTIWLFVSQFTQLVPTEWTGTLRAIFFGVGIVSLFIQGRMWGSGTLPTALKVLFWFNLLAQTVLTFSTLVLINGLSLLITAGVGYFSTSRRLPWIPFLALVPIIAVLHNGKAEMRYIYWSNKSLTVTLTQLPAYFTQWVEFGLNPTANERGNEKEKDENLAQGLMQRASLYHIVCIAVETMPERSPFLLGESYTMLPAQLVPRMLWPNKPSPQASVRLLAIHFGIQSEEATEGTSIGFGMLAEAYANFGYFCVCLLGFVLSWLFRRLALATTHCATLSPAGLMRILCIVWCFSVENTLALWFSSFYQACVAIGVPLLAWKSLFND